MAAPPPLLPQLLSACIVVAERAGDIIRGVMDSGKLETKDKGVGDPQTKADRDAQDAIVHSLRAWFPGLRVVAEEEVEDPQRVAPEAARAPLAQAAPPTLAHVAGACAALPESLRDARAGELTLWVDPLDGTADFARGDREPVTVLIGVSHQGRAVAGVVHVPFSAARRTVWGAVGVGAFDGPRALRPPTPWSVAAARPLRVVTTGSHFTAATQQRLDEMERRAALGRFELRRVGGTGFKALLVLEGLADAYLYAQSGTKRWDSCAVEALIHATGGHFVDAYGRAIAYDAAGDYRNSAGLLCVRAGVPLERLVLEGAPQKL